MNSKDFWEAVLHKLSCMEGEQLSFLEEAQPT